MSADASELLPQVWSELIGSVAPRAEPDSLCSETNLDHVLWAAHVYAHPLLRGNRNECSFQVILFQTGLLAALYPPSVAKGFLSAMASGPAKLSRNSTTWKTLGALAILALTGRDRLLSDPELPGGLAIARLVGKSQASRREQLTDKAVESIVARFASSGRDKDLGWDPQFQ